MADIREGSSEVFVAWPSWPGSEHKLEARPRFLVRGMAILAMLVARARSPCHGD
ncbi:MAG: hypothetical protein ACRC8S_16580 [Fimbriiglobus sp.]